MMPLDEAFSDQETAGLDEFLSSRARPYKYAAIGSESDQHTRARRAQHARRAASSFGQDPRGNPHAGGDACLYRSFWGLAIISICLAPLVLFLREVKPGLFPDSRRRPSTRRTVRRAISTYLTNPGGGRTMIVVARVVERPCGVSRSVLALSLKGLADSVDMKPNLSGFPGAVLHP